MIEVLPHLQVHPRAHALPNSNTGLNARSWTLIYLICALGFASGIYVLYRNERAFIGKAYHKIGDLDCTEFDTTVGRSLRDTFTFLLRQTLQGSDAWECTEQSAAQNPGMLMLILFLMIVIIMLLNMVITPCPQHAPVQIEAFHIETLVSSVVRFCPLDCGLTAPTRSCAPAAHRHDGRHLPIDRERGVPKLRLFVCQGTRTASLLTWGCTAVQFAHSAVPYRLDARRSRSKCCQR